jgi:hypothetical protein
MKGIFWNSRGLSDLAKTRFLRETSIEQDLAFIALLETGKQDLSQRSLNNFSGGNSFSLALDRPSGKVRGYFAGG